MDPVNAEVVNAQRVDVVNAKRVPGSRRLLVITLLLGCLVIFLGLRLLRTPRGATAAEDLGGFSSLATGTDDRDDCLRNIDPVLKQEARRLILKRGLDEADAHDLIADVLLKVCSKQPQRFDSYFIASIQNAVLTWKREEARSCPRPDETAPDCHETVEETYLREEQRALLRYVMCALYPEEQEVLEHRFFREQDYPEIADELGIKVDAAKKRVSRALEHARELYFTHCPVVRN